MDFFQILTDIEKVDPEVYARFDTRRRVFKHMSGLGKKLTAATMPAVVSAMFNKAYGQTTLPSIIVDTLNLALSLEYLEYYYYSQGVSSGLFTGNDLAAITIIRDDELGHINVIKATLASQAIANPGATAFDYTANGNVAPFSSPAMFLAVAQSFVDTGVRAYKGGAANLIANKDILTAALNIHSIEARHSSHIRTMRRGYSTGVANTNGTTIVGQEAGGTGDAIPKSWVSLQENGGPKPNKTVATLYNPTSTGANDPLTAAVYGAGTPATTYPAESNVMQSTLNVQTSSTAPTGLTITAAAASEAFDEPLDAATVKAIARNFRSAIGASLGLFNA